MKVKNRLAFVFIISTSFFITNCDSVQTVNPSSINYPLVAIQVSKTYNLGDQIDIDFSLAVDSYVIFWIQAANLLSDIEKQFHHLENINYFNFNQVISESNILINDLLWAGSHQVQVDSNEFGKGVYYIFLVATGSDGTSFSAYKTILIK